jgi:hypothetical protein
MRKIYVTFLFSLITITAIAQSQLNYPDLVKRLSEFEYLAHPPVKGENSGRFTSYDRDSHYDEESQTYIHWDASRDGTGFIREEGIDSPVSHLQSWMEMGIQSSILFT